MTKTAQQRLRDGYAARSPQKPKEEESPEMERIRAGLSPSHRTSVGYARIRRENRR
jgi:hypothetical protein